jgi:hypothetical protein
MLQNVIPRMLYMLYASWLRAYLMYIMFALHTYSAITIISEFNVVKSGRNEPYVCRFMNFNNEKSLLKGKIWIRCFRVLHIIFFFFFFFPFRSMILLPRPRMAGNLFLASYTIHTLHCWIYIKFKVAVELTLH